MITSCMTEFANISAALLKFCCSGSVTEWRTHANSKLVCIISTAIVSMYDSVLTCDTNSTAIGTLITMLSQMYVRLLYGLIFCIVQLDIKLRRLTTQ